MKRLLWVSLLFPMVGFAAVEVEVRTEYTCTVNPEGLLAPTEYFVVSDYGTEGATFSASQDRANAVAELDDGYVTHRCYICLLYTSPSPRDGLLSRMPSSA